MSILERNPKESDNQWRARVLERNAEVYSRLNGTKDQELAQQVRHDAKELKLKNDDPIQEVDSTT